MLKLTGKKHYTKEFKKEAVDLLKNSEKGSLKIANDLGISRDNLLRRNREFETEESETGTVMINSNDSEEVKRLKKEMQILKQERDILKKALGIFSKPEE